MCVYKYHIHNPEYYAVIWYDFCNMTCLLVIFHIAHMHIFVLSVTALYDFAVRYFLYIAFHINDMSIFADYDLFLHV